MAILLNKAALAEFLGYSEQTLTEWQTEGMPIVRAGARGQSNEYDSAAVVAWLLERAVKKVRAESARDELYRSQKRLADLQIAEKERTLVNAKEVEEEYARLVVAARQRLLQIPGRLAPELHATASAADKQALLKEAIHEALTDISHYDPASPAPIAA